MTPAERVRALWSDMAQRKWDALPFHFLPDAQISWPNTGERFTAEEFGALNAAYPERWDITVERLETMPSLAISVVRVRSEDRRTSFHAVSFFELEGDKIRRLTEYWGEDGPPPQWRRTHLP